MCFVFLKLFLPVQVFYSTGTKVIVEIRDYKTAPNTESYLNIYVEPSPLDVRKTIGLCGTLNGQRDEFFVTDTEYYLKWK